MDLSPAFNDTLLENRTFDEIAIGDNASSVRTLTEEDIELFAVVSGDVNPSHIDPAFAETDLFHKVIAHGMWGAGLISGVLGTRLPGPGTLYLSQELRFGTRVGIGDTVTTTVTAREKQPDCHAIVFDCRCVNQLGQEVIAGLARVQAPTEKIRKNRIELPDVRLGRHRRCRFLL